MGINVPGGQQVNQQRGQQPTTPQEPLQPPNINSVPNEPLQSPQFRYNSAPQEPLSVPGGGQQPPPASIGVNPIPQGPSLPTYNPQNPLAAQGVNNVPQEPLQSPMFNSVPQEPLQPPGGMTIGPAQQTYINYSSARPFGNQSQSFGPYGTPNYGAMNYSAGGNAAGGAQMGQQVK